MKRLRWIATLLMATALVASACTGDDGTSTDGAGGGGSGSGEQVTLDFWVFGEIAGGSFYETLVAEFETTDPDIDIDLTSYPEENYDTKIDTAVAAGKAPELILIFGSNYPRQGLVLPLDEMVAEKGIDLSTYSQAIMGEGGDFSCGWEGNSTASVPTRASLPRSTTRTCSMKPGSVSGALAAHDAR